MKQSTRATLAACWRISGRSAELDVRGLQGTVNLSAPQLGLGNLCVFGRSLSGSVLGIQFDTGHMQHPLPLADSYQRGCDLIATYEQTDERPFRPSVYWRALQLAERRPAAAVDSIVSVQTSLLETTPQLCSKSRLDATEVLRRSAPAMRDASPGECGCVILRLRYMDATYCEMIHPSDCRGLETRRVNGAVEISWSLVGHFMEKGVVRRVRVRGVFVDGPPHDGHIRNLYEQFIASPPPLTT